MDVSMKWFEKRATDEELTLAAWAHLLNDPFISVYTMEDGVENRQWVNPELAFRRLMIGTANTMSAVRDHIQSEMMPAIAGMSEAFTNFGNAFTQSSVSDSDGV